MIADKDSDVSGIGPDLLPFACSRNGVTDKGSNISVLFFFPRKTGMKMKKKRSNLMNKT